ncbi:Fc.00g065860.m01.CDS01 [Cosmosporella sp. VM-42]
MITKFMTEVTAKFNPFSASAKPARLFLTLLPPTARANGLAISTQLLPRTSAEPSSLRIKFKDGKELNFNCEKINIKGLVEESDRHSRQLQKTADLTD